MNRAERRRITRGTGVGQEAVSKYHVQDLPKAPAGQHQWITLAMYRTNNPDADQQNLDMENLLSIEGPGCFVCEQPYSREVAARPCPGEPS